MVDVSVQRTIPVPVGRVAEYAGDPGNSPEWYDRIHEAVWVTQAVVAVGSAIRFRARFLGRELDYTYEVVGYNPLDHLVMRTADGPFPMETSYRWQAVENDSTLMELRNRGEPTGWSRVVTPLVVVAMRRAMTGDLANLERRLVA